VNPRHTDFRLAVEEEDVSIQEIYSQLTHDENRNDMIFNDLLTSLEVKRSPLLLTERTEQVEYFAGRLEEFARNVIAMRGGLGERQREEIAERIAAIPEGEERVLVATGRYIGESFDDARLDTLFLSPDDIVERDPAAVCRTPAPPIRSKEDNYDSRLHRRWGAGFDANV